MSDIIERLRAPFAFTEKDVQDAIAEITRLREENARYKLTYAKYVEATDRMNGAPCEQIRHQQEVDALREENARLRKALKPFADAAEGTGMFYTVDIWDARVFDSEEEAKKWCKDGERPQIMLGG